MVLKTLSEQCGCREVGLRLYSVLYRDYSAGVNQPRDAVTVRQIERYLGRQSGHEWKWRI